MLSEQVFTHFSSFAAVVIWAIQAKGGVVQVRDIHHVDLCPRELSVLSSYQLLLYLGHLTKRRDHVGTRI